MNRKEFIKQSLLLGVGASILPSIFSACSKDEDFEYALPLDFNGDVLIIGAGAAGMMAAYRLAQNNINVTVIEAGATFGGRVKKTTTFADFPIDIGAEWIHEQPSIFQKLINDPKRSGSIELVPYNPRQLKIWNGSALQDRSMFVGSAREYKFKATTWHDFFEDYIVPVIGENNFIYNSPVQEIDYSSNKVRVSVAGGAVYEADKLLVTVPITILKDGDISFIPALPDSTANAIKQFHMPDGMKAFIEFSEKFYPDATRFAVDTDFGEADEVIYYNAAFKKNSNRHILGLFTVGDMAVPYASLNTEEEIIAKILSDLDLMFDGKATETYQKHIIQNWSKEPYIRGSYAFSRPSEAASELSIPVDGKIAFAGEAMSDGATVHNAGFSGYAQIAALVNSQ